MNVFKDYLPLVLQLMARMPGLVAKAQAAFSGKPGSGELKKELVEEGIKEAIADLNILAPDLLTEEQENAIVATVMSITDSIVLGLNTAKLFETTTPKV